MGLEKTSDQDLSRMCRRSDPEAWRELVRRRSPAVYRLALRMLGTRQDAEDACQRVFMRVHRSFDSYDASRPLGPWISGIAYRECLRLLASPSRARTVGGDPETAAAGRDDDGPGPETLAAAGETRTMIEVALDRLAAQDRALVVLRYHEGLSDAEIAGATGMPVGTVKVRLHRARGRLRQILAPALEDR